MLIIKELCKQSSCFSAFVFKFFFKHKDTESQNNIILNTNKTIIKAIFVSSCLRVQILFFVFKFTSLCLRAFVLKISSC